MHMSRYLLGNDQMSETVILYDLDALLNLPDGDVLDQAAVRAFPSGHVADVRRRENTVFGDVLLIGGDTTSLYSFEGGTLLWSTSNAGNNTHAAEILPSGNIVTVNSTGNDIRLFRTSALLRGDVETAATYVSYPFYCTHGVLWDPAYDCLWVLGGSELAAYRLVGEGVDQILEEIPERRYALQDFGTSDGHDLAPDLSDPRYLLITVAKYACRFDKEAETTVLSLPDDGLIPSIHLKSLSMDEDGSLIYTFANHGIGRSWQNHWMASWLTDTIHVVLRNADGSATLRKFSSATAGFYKCRSCYGKYQ